MQEQKKLGLADQSLCLSLVLSDTQEISYTGKHDISISFILMLES